MTVPSRRIRSGVPDWYPTGDAYLQAYWNAPHRGEGTWSARADTFSIPTLKPGESGVEFRPLFERQAASETTWRAEC